MLRTLGWALWLFGYMLCRVPYSWRMKCLEKRGRHPEARAILDSQVQRWSQKLLRHTRLQVTVQGQLPPAGSHVVYVANHQSYLDIPILLAHLTPPPPLLAKGELGKVPILGFWMKKLGCVFVERDDARSGIAALKAAQQTVEAGQSMVVFPEGTRSKGDDMGEFQAGAVRIATKAGVPIVPLAIDGSHKGLEGAGYRVSKTPVPVRLVVLPMVETKGLDRAGQKALPQRLAAEIAAAKDAGKALGPGE